MSEGNNNKPDQQKNLKIFFIKLISISFVVIITANLMFNLIFAERLEKIDKIFLLNSSEFRNEIKDKIRNELNDGLNNEHLLSEEDRILFYKLYIKLQKEFQDLDKDKLKD